MEKITDYLEPPMTILKTLLIASALLFYLPVSLADNGKAGTGTVAETMLSGGYVYVRLEEDGTWLASTPVPLSVGDRISYADSATMKNFRSRTLDRTFDYILFVNKLEVVNQPDAAEQAAVARTNPHVAKSTGTATAPQTGEIIPLDSGKTIAGILAEYKQLKDQQVALRARVMKVSPNILGKNWITLQDGTGTAPDNQLMATSSDVVAVGNLVTVRGVIHTDVDLGSGYRYAVLLEDAAFSQ